MPENRYCCFDITGNLTTVALRYDDEEKEIEGFEKDKDLRTFSIIQFYWIYIRFLSA